MSEENQYPIGLCGLATTLALSGAYSCQDWWRVYRGIYSTQRWSRWDCKFLRRQAIWFDLKDLLHRRIQKRSYLEWAIRHRIAKSENVPRNFLLDFCLCKREEENVSRSHPALAILFVHSIRSSRRIYTWYAWSDIFWSPRRSRFIYIWRYYEVLALSII